MVKMIGRVDQFRASNALKLHWKEHIAKSSTHTSRVNWRRRQVRIKKKKSVSPLSLLLSSLYLLYLSVTAHAVAPATGNINHQPQ